MDRLFLSPPHISGKEFDYVKEAFDSNWIAPAGPHLKAFEQEICDYTNAPFALAVSSGTAAIHLSLLHLGVDIGDEVFVSTLTFSASVNPIFYQKAKPVFIDSNNSSWNMDPALLAEALEHRAKINNLPKAVIVVHLYGQSADLSPIMAVCQKYNVPLIEDAAESLGGYYDGKHTGTFGRSGVFSFNGNKIITTSGGGMLVSHDEKLIEHARKLSTQAREPMPHYEHTEIGFNYRMSNVLAGIGRGQLELIEERVSARRNIFDYYAEHLAYLPGLSFMPEADKCRHNRWLTTLTIDPKITGTDRETVRLALEKENIESRPVWKPMHMQPVFKDYEAFGGAISEKLFQNGLCLPSGSAMTVDDQDRVIHVLKQQLSAPN